LIPELGYDEDRNLVYVKFEGKLAVDEYSKLAEFFNSLPEEKKMRYLADVTELEGSLLDRKTREMFAGSTARFPESKIAVVGGNPVTRMICKTVVVTMGKLKETGFLKNEAEAVSWLGKIKIQ